MWSDLTLDPPLQGLTRIAKLKSAYYLLIIGPTGLQCETTLYGIMGWESSDVVRFDLEPLLQGQTRTSKLKRVYNLFIIISPDESRGYIGFRSVAPPPPPP